MLYTLIQNISIWKIIRSKNKMGEPGMALSIGREDIKEDFDFC